MASYKQIGMIIGISALVIAGIWLLVGHQKGDVDLFAKRATGPIPGPLAVDESGALTNPNNQDVHMINQDNPRVVFHTSHGDITFEVFADMMPQTSENFLTLVRDGFYDGTKFHRVIDGFMVQGGDPNSKSSDTSTYGQGGPGYTIQDEFVTASHLTNVRGTVAMANTGQPDSGGSQFFINLVDNTGLDFDKQPLSSKHPVFAHVIDGMEVVDVIGKTETNPDDVPIEPIVIESAEVVE